MSKHKRHVQSRRGEEYVQLIRDVPRDKIVCVSIDVHKYFHKVMIHNSYGEILTPSFRIDVFAAGFERLCREIDRAVAASACQVLFIGMEPTGHYFENLAYHLRKRYPHVRLVNSYAVKHNRAQKMLQKQKNEETDLTAIGDLVLRNESFEYAPPTGVYLELQYWVRYRKADIKTRTTYRNRVIVHLDHIFPGLVRRNKAACKDQPQLFPSFWTSQTAQRLIRLCPNPHVLVSMSVAQLIQLYHDHGWAMGHKRAQRILDFAHLVLLPNPQDVAIRLIFLEKDLLLLDQIEARIAQADVEIERCLRQTVGMVLTLIKGINIQHAAAYVAGIGDPTRYQNARQTFKRSGLVSGRNDSGAHQRDGEGQGITRVGDPHLRNALVQLTRSLLLWQPYFDIYCRKLKNRGKHHNVALVATARKVNGVLFALMRDQAVFDPRDQQGRPVSPRRTTRKIKVTANRDPSKAALS